MQILVVDDEREIADLVALYLKNGVRAIEGNTVYLENGRLPADLILLSVGVRPETTLAETCGIATNGRGQI